MQPDMIYICCLLLLATHVAAQNCEWESAGQSGLHLNCKGLHLIYLPTHLLNSSITELDVSQNNISILPASAFEKCLTVHYLNLSMCGIRHVDVTALRSLTSLKILDFTNNVFLSYGIPDGLFTDCVSLVELFVGGYTFEMKPVAAISSLHKITLTATPEQMPYELANLTNLDVINFWNSDLQSHLSIDMLAPLRGPNVKELAFINCDLDTLENGTFSGFTSLTYLNFAGNMGLHIDNIIDAITTSDGVTLNSLVLDLVGVKNSKKFVLGKKDNPCRHAWKSIEQLSLRAVNLQGVRQRFLKCVPNLQIVSFGMNSVQKGPEGAYALFPALMQLQSIDGSYWGISDLREIKYVDGYYNSYGWKPANMDYFPPKYNASQFPKSHETNRHTRNNCSTYRFPQKSHLQYIKLDHCINFDKSSQSGCIEILNNDLRYLNVSHMITNKPIIMNYTIMGLDVLEVIDGSDSMVEWFNFATFQYTPSLRVLKLAGNILGNHPIDELPYMPRLEQLDLSRNRIKQFPSEVFRKLPSLKHLNLAGNEIFTVQFMSTNLRSLHFLDLSNNKIFNLNRGATAKLDVIFSNTPGFAMDITKNPLQCGCDGLDFIEWVQAKTITLMNMINLTCQDDMLGTFINDIDVQYTKVKCGLTVNTRVISSVSVVLIVMTLTVAIITYKLRWRIKWRLYKWRYLRRKRGNNTLLENLNGGGKFSAYVIYSQDDEEISEWVFRTLRPMVEDAWHMPAMFLVGRDDIAGNTILDNIVLGITESCIALWIVSDSFFADHTCETSANFAFHELGVGKNLIIDINSLDQYTIQKAFTNLFNPQVGISRLRYPEDPDGRQLFWRKLEAFFLVSID